jgi:hypothetical protein
MPEIGTSESDEKRDKDDSDEKRDKDEDAQLKKEWEEITEGFMDDGVGASDGQQYPPGSFKAKVLGILADWRFEVFIVILIVADLVCTLYESGLDYNVICITPMWIPHTRNKILHEVGEEHGPLALIGHDSMRSAKQQNQSYTAPSLFTSGEALRTEAVRGAVMLQVSKVGKMLYDLAEFTDKQPDSHGEGNPLEEEEAHAEHKGNHKNHIIGTLLCEGPHGPKRHYYAHWAHILGGAILATFLVEMFFKAWLSWKRFIGSKMQLLDFALVFVSFLAEVIWPMIVGLDPGILQADWVKTTLLLIRFVRVGRVFHSSMSVAHKGYSHVRELKNTLHEREEEITKLKAALKGKNQK